METSVADGPLTILRWMPPQRVHRMVQYSHPPRPARPGMMLSTTRPALHCGQADVTGGGGGGDRRLCPDSLFGMGPGETDFERRKRQAVDHDRFLVGALDSRVPKTPSGLKGFDVKAAVESVHVRSGGSPVRRQTRARPGRCEAIHICGNIAESPELVVMPGLVPGIHVLRGRRKDVDGRDEARP